MLVHFSQAPCASSVSFILPFSYLVFPPSWVVLVRNISSVQITLGLECLRIGACRAIQPTLPLPGHCYKEISSRNQGEQALPLDCPGSSDWVLAFADSIAPAKPPLEGGDSFVFPCWYVCWSESEEYSFNFIVFLLVGSGFFVSKEKGILVLLKVGRV